MHNENGFTVTHKCLLCSMGAKGLILLKTGSFGSLGLLRSKKIVGLTGAQNGLLGPKDLQRAQKASLQSMKTVSLTGAPNGLKGLIRLKAHCAQKRS